jgi:hypothetical protein
MAFLGFSNVQIKWTKTDSNLGTVVSKNHRQTQTTWTDIYSNNYYAEDLLSLELDIAATETYTLDFNAISYERLGFTLEKQWTKLKFLYIENLDTENYIDIGSSGLSYPLGIVCEDADIGPLGVYVYSDKAGIAISGYQKDFQLVNNSGSTISVRIVAAGEF